MDLIIILKFWWLPTVFILFWGFWKIWMYYIQNHYLATREWMLLEIRIPEQVQVTPKAMEQVMAGLHGAYKGGNLMDKYLTGFLPHFFSLEIAGINGEIHFFIRTQASFKNLVESQVYAQYPNAEIQEAEDYTKAVPKEMPNKNWNLWGSEVIFTREDYYPIRTYPSFKEESLKDEGIIDPLASLAEIMSRLKDGEQLWVQFLISAVHGPWQQKGWDLVNKLIGKPVKRKKPGVLVQETIGWLDTIKEVFLGVISPGSAEEKQEWPSMMQHLSPGEKSRVEAIENKAAKLGFNSKIRFVYLGKRDVFSMANVAAFFGAMKQFAIQDLNGFIPCDKTKSTIDYFMKKRRSAHRRRKILTKYRWRSMGGNKIILNVEELASLYHFPGLYVKAPMMPRIEAKKGTPPVGLPVG